MALIVVYVVELYIIWMVLWGFVIIVRKKYDNVEKCLWEYDDVIFEIIIEWWVYLFVGYY